MLENSIPLRTQDDSMRRELFARVQLESDVGKSVGEEIAIKQETTAALKVEILDDRCRRRKLDAESGKGKTSKGVAEMERRRREANHEKKTGEIGRILLVSGTLAERRERSVVFYRGLGLEGGERVFSVRLAVKDH